MKKRPYDGEQIQLHHRRVSRFDGWESAAADITQAVDSTL